MMRYYNNELDLLFDEWIRVLYSEKQDSFCRDGLMINDKENESLVDELWEDAPRRILFLVKDKDTPDGDDTRRWMIEGEHVTEMRRLRGGIVGRTGFFPNIARIFYGLLNDDITHRVTFEEVKAHFNEVVRTFNTFPFAFMEAKKEAGFSSVHFQDVHMAEERDKDYIKREFDILAPDIIVCCDAGDVQYDFVVKNYLKGLYFEEKRYLHPDKEAGECCLRYYPDKHIMVIKSFHPTNRGRRKTQYGIFERVISPFHNYLLEISERHPGVDINSLLFPRNNQ